MTALWASARSTARAARPVRLDPVVVGAVGVVSSDAGILPPAPRPITSAPRAPPTANAAPPPSTPETVTRRALTSAMVDSRMTSITSPLPIYDALLQLATPAERDAILAGGPRKALDNNLVFGDEAECRAAKAAYAAIERIISRVKQDRTLRVTGLDVRVTPPRREPIDAEVVLTGRLMWEGKDGVRSVLQLEWGNPTVRLIDIHVEPIERPVSDALPPMSPSARLSGAERIDDTERLRLMQRYIDAEGLPPKTAAKRVAAKMPNPPTGEESIAVRLVRKFRQRLQE